MIVNHIFYPYYNKLFYVIRKEMDNRTYDVSLKETYGDLVIDDKIDDYEKVMVPHQITSVGKSLHVLQALNHSNMFIEYLKTLVDTDDQNYNDDDDDDDDDESQLIDINDDEKVSEWRLITGVGKSLSVLEAFSKSNMLIEHSKTHCQKNDCDVE